MQKKITRSDLLLDRNGRLKVSGWSYNNLLSYDNAHVKDNLSLLTQRDTFTIYEQEYFLYFSITKRNKKACATVIFVDFKRSVVISETYYKPKFSGKVIMSKSSSEGRTLFEINGCSLLIKRIDGKAVVKGSISNFNGNSMKFAISLEKTGNASLSTAKDFAEKKGCFVYKNYIPLLMAKGKISFSGNDYSLDDKDVAGSLNWIRGTIPNNTDVKSLYINDFLHTGTALCLSSDFGNVKDCNDNFVIYNSNFLKLEDVNIKCRNKTLGAWEFYSENEDLNLIFSPIKYRGKVLYFTFENRILILGKAICNMNFNYTFFQREENHLAFLEIEVF